MGKLKRDVCLAEDDCFLFRVPRGDCFFEIRLDSPRAGREREFLQAWRAEQDKRDSKRGTRAGRKAEESLCRASNPGKTDVKNREILCFVQDVPMAWRSGPTWWSLQNRGSPCPRSRAKRGGRAPEAPKGGRRVSRRGDVTRPLDAKPAGGIRHFPRKTSRGTRPARPAGGGTNAFCFPSLVAPAPPRLPELSVPRLRAGEISCITTIQPSRAPPAETFVPNPRECRAIIFHDASPARCPK